MEAKPPISYDPCRTRCRRPIAEGLAQDVEAECTMPSIQENIRRWSGFDWSRRGTEWCAGFGGVDAAWEHAILPRIRHFVPTGHILELGPGFGVWTDFLYPGRSPNPLSSRMTLVDLAPNCIEFCRQRFEQHRVECFTNDGRSLEMVPDDSVDFVFSFNSLVHADRDVITAYIRQLGAKMRPGAVGFIHHSNLGMYGDELDTMDPTHQHWRGRDMTGKLFRSLCRQSGLLCVFQELVPWGSKRFIDAHSLFVKPLPGVEYAERVKENPDYWHQARAGDHTPSAWYTLPSTAQA